MKKILLLGGSAQQTVAIRAAKKLGYFTIVCDYLPDNPGQYIADRFYGASTTDVEAIYEIARKEGVDGILAYASDPAALPAAIVAERLGLPTNPAKSVEILGLKHPWRQFLQKNGFACPKVYTFHPNTPISEIQDHSDHFSFPLVVKPTDSSGSKGVTMLNNWSGLEDAVRRADSFSRNKTNASSLKLKRKQATKKFVVSGLAAGDSVKSWTSSNQKIVKVFGSGNGACTIKAGNKTGKAKITITLVSGLKKTINVTVQKNAVACTSIKNVPKKITLNAKKSYQLKPVINPITCTYKAIYKTSNKKIVKVTSRGKITAVKKGKAKITVMVGKKKFVCTVTIK